MNASDWLGPLDIVQPIYGFIMPALILVTLVANTLIIIVLSRYGVSRKIVFLLNSM